MILYPAIDLLEGKVVRLVQGDFAQQTVFAADPQEAVEKIAQTGVRFLHLVDLSGARDPSQRQMDLLTKILKATSMRVQLGGGIRSLQEISALLALGADRVVLGSLCVTQPELAKAALQEFGPDRLTFALDVKLQNEVPMVMTHGWKEASGKSFSQVLEPYLELGLRRILCTDIAVDGRLSGPNVALYRSLQAAFPSLELQASGGVAELSDLRTLKEAAVHSVVVGRALLEGRFTLTEALAFA